MTKSSNYALFEDELFDIINTKLPDNKLELEFKNTAVAMRIL